ncbi:MAG: DoxX family protein [Planctomycetota bacterium]|jgi:uncharacterized membrane protein YphA (DoxX/SURF4 family)
MGDQCKRYFQLGAAAVVLLVILRLSLGCHFLYEGVWKIKHPEFSAEGFLTQAKGPAAPIFHAMVPDMYGTERLKIEKLLTAESLIARWRKVRDDSESSYAEPYRKRFDAFDARRKRQKGKLSPEDQKKLDEARKKISQIKREFGQPSRLILWEHEDKLEAFVANSEKAMIAFFEARNSGQADGDGKKSAGRAKDWLSGINEIQDGYFAALKKLAGKDNQANVAVAGAIKKVAPVFDQNKPVEKVVGNHRLLASDGQDVLRAARAIRAEKFYQPWSELKEEVIGKYGLDDRQQVEAEVIFRRYKEAVKSVLAENQADIAGYFGALDRLEKEVETGNQGAAHQKQRVYDERQKLQAEVRVWLAGLEATEQGYRSALAGLLTPEQAKKGALPESWTRTDLINFAVTYGLTAIGLCLLLGLFTRPAAVAGGLFMFSVILTQPNWPGIYPPASPEAGHALLINKDFVEMIALFALAATPVGRWGGLDFFVENFILRLLRSRKNRKG